MAVVTIVRPHLLSGDDKGLLTLGDVEVSATLGDSDGVVCVDHGGSLRLTTTGGEVLWGFLTAPLSFLSKPKVGEL